MSEIDLNSERKSPSQSRKKSSSLKPTNHGRSQSARPIPPSLHIRRLSEPLSPTIQSQQERLNKLTEPLTPEDVQQPQDNPIRRKTSRPRTKDDSSSSSKNKSPDNTASSPKEKSKSNSERKKSKKSSSSSPTKEVKSRSKSKKKESDPVAEKQLALSRSIFGHVQKLAKDFENYNTAIHIRQTDVLVPSHHLKRPLVRVHVVDAATGLYLSKKDRNTPVTSFHEPKDVDYVMPILTEEYPLLLNQGHSAKWEEKVYLNEDYLHIVKEHVLVFFEILNVLPPSKSFWRPIGDGWHRVAWAFLSLVGADGKSNTEKEVRLQLYHYPWSFRSAGSQRDIPEVYYLWKSMKRKKYPSSLYLSIYAVPKKDVVEVMYRPNQPTQREKGKLTYEELLDKYNSKKKLVEPMMRTLIQRTSQHVWRRKEGQRCRMPNKLLYRIDPGSQGSFTCSFSTQGAYLAVACVQQRSYPLKIYDVVTGDRVAQLEGHQDLVYQLSWSADDRQLFSVSSDGSARIWSIVSGSFVQTFLFQHPTFVYTGCFHPLASKEAGVVATGAYDGIIRVWSYSEEARMAKSGFMKPARKLFGHESNVNSIIFDKDGSKMYSGDGKGVLKIWSNRSVSPAQQKGTMDNLCPVDYDCIKSIDLVGGHAIQSLTSHLSNRKILVHCANQALHCLDTRIFRFLTHFQVPHVREDPASSSHAIERKLPFTHTLGPRSDPLPSSGLWPSFLSPAHRVSSPTWIRSTFSPCGNYVLCGSQKGSVYVWNADTGLLVACYDKQHLSKWEDGAGPIVSVAFHPQEHMFALSSWGESKTVKVWTWDENIPEIKLAETQAQETSKAHKPPQMPMFDVDKIIAQSMGSKIHVDRKDIPPSAIISPVIPNMITAENTDAYERRPLGIYDGKYRVMATS